MRSTSWPALSTSSVGILPTLNRDAVAGFSSTLTLAKRIRPAISDASSSIMGAIILHGLHHGAHMSTTTGTDDCSTSAANVASVTVTGTSTGRRVLQRPQTGARLPASFSCGIRFFAPQD